MAITIGPSIDDGLWIDNRIWGAVVLPPDDTSGASVNSTTGGDAAAGDAALQANELVGKLGAKIAPYDPEGTNRLIQEF